jgi:pSer/pThr/pTyr-binding forkhead associated (FHA) protein
MPRLVVERGNEKGLSCALEAPATEIVVGRLQSCNLVITDPLASRRHFTIVSSNGTFSLMDHGSHNGTYLNGKRVEGTVPLNFGAAIRAGETLFELSDRDTDKGVPPERSLAATSPVERIGIGEWAKSTRRTAWAGGVR